MSSFAPENCCAAPTSMAAKHLRACLRCRLVKTGDQFKSDSCENCNWDNQSWKEYTTPSYKGVIAMMKPNQSWVARWQKQEKLQPGLYAVQVSGSLALDDNEEEEDEDE